MPNDFLKKISNRMDHATLVNLKAWYACDYWRAAQHIAAPAQA